MLRGLRFNDGMFTSAEPPTRDFTPSRREEQVAAWDDVYTSPRVSHRVAFTFIIGTSLGGYGLLYVIGSLVSHLLIGA